MTASYEKELFTDFRASLEFYYKKSHQNIWTIGMNEAGALDSQANYYLSGNEPITGNPIYGRDADYDFWYSYRANFSKRHTKYYAGQLVLIKRLSRRWMMNASVTYSNWKEFYENEFADPQNVQYYDGAANSSMNARWQFKLSGLYQLPFGVNLSTVFRAREGYVRGTYANAKRPGIGTRAVYGNPDGGGKYGDLRLPNFYEIDLRIEKTFQVSEKSRVLLSIDSFNAFNYAHVLSRQDFMGTAGAPNAQFGRALRILNPSVFRFGIRFEF